MKAGAASKNGEIARYNRPRSAGIAQLVERNLAKVEVESSRLFSRSTFRKGSPVLPFFLSPEMHVRAGTG